jgi:O-antigen/teichoic acid export membrane protein
MNKILSNYLFNTTYQLLVIFLPFITTPYVSRVLGPEQLGVNAYTFSIVNILMVAGMFGIPLYGSRQIGIYSTKGLDELSKEFWSIYSLQLAGMLICSVGYLCYSLTLSPALMKIFLIQGIQLIASMIDISWLLMGLQRFKETVTRNFLVKMLTIILIFTVVKKRSDLDLYIMVISVSTLIGQIILWFSAKKYINLKPVIDRERFGQHFKPILILFVPQLLGQLYLSLDKVILNFFDSKVQVGYYDQAMKIIKLLLTIVTSISTVMLPNMSAEFARGNNEKVLYYVEMIFRFVLFITIPMMVGLSGISTNFVSWFLGPEFSKVALLLRIISPIILFIGLGSLFGIQILVATHQNNKLTISIAAGATVSILVSLIFVPIYGVWATAIATLLTEATVACVQFFFVRSYIKVRNIYKSFFTYIFSAGIMLLVIYFLNYIPVSAILKTFIQVIGGFAAYILLLFILKETLIVQLRDRLKVVLNRKFGV